MEGYDTSTYGDRFADVYDDWYGDISDVEATVATVVELTPPGGRVLELGVGTGRLALPLHAAGVCVEGIDSSQAMVDQMRAKAGGTDISTVIGDMAELPLTGPFDGVFVAFNTFFNLPSDDSQLACFRRVRELLSPDGWFVIEAFIPSEEPEALQTDVHARDLTADRVVLNITRRDPHNQTVTAQHIEISENGGVRMRPSFLHYARPEQLDALARKGGLVLAERWSDWTRAPFDPDGAHHVSLYRPTDG